MPVAPVHDLPPVAQRMAETADLVTLALDQLLPRGDGPEGRLCEAMRYAALAPGKRVRPFFAIEAARMLEADEQAVLRAACALECIHIASLVHDDLPCMDDDDLRRGFLTVHRAYDEPTAILAGDALQSAAFEILSHDDTHDDAEVRCELVRLLAQTAGAQGHAGGQMIDVIGPEGLPELTRLHRLKSVSMTVFAFQIPLVVVDAGEGVSVTLMDFAHDLAMAQHLAWALGDRIGQPGPGRTEGVRGHGRRPDLVTHMGEQAARAQLEALIAQANGRLDIFGRKARYLREGLDFVLHGFN